jgi:hypothetical protein
MFSDIVMPGGMNGFDLAQAASGMRPNSRSSTLRDTSKGAMVHQDEPRFKQGLYHHEALPPRGTAKSSGML